MRRRTVNAGVAAGILLVSVVGSVLVDPTAAFAHSNYVSGVATCANVGANIDITWTVSNDYNLTETATVTSATGGVGTVSGSPANIAASPGQPYKFAIMKQVLPGTTTGSATLGVKGVWSDNYSTTDWGTVTLPTGCVAPPATVTTAPANGSVVLGASDADTATVTGVGGVTPTGGVTFYVCGPFTAATACTTSGTKLGTVALAGSGNTATATGPSFTATSTGTYCFLGVYSGDGNYAGGSDGSTTRECFTVGKATPSFTTTPADPNGIVLGSSSSDSATVTGVTGTGPTGTVSFSVCKESTVGTACTGGSAVGSLPSPTSTSGAVSTYTLAAGIFTPTATGTYCFSAAYGGDANYSAVSLETDPAAECFAVTMATPGFTTSPANATIVLGGSDTDTAKVTGVLGVTPTGTVTFYVCGPFTTATACTTSGTKVGAGTLAGSGNTATAASPSFTPTATGIYCFLGVYSGDGNYATRSDGSTTRECFAVTPATPGVSSSPANATITLGNSDTDTATVTGVLGVTPTGTVTFYVCGPFASATACTTSGTKLGTVTLAGSGGTATAIGPAYTPLSTGTYCFLGVYSGDGNYGGGSDGSIGECFGVTPPQPGVKTAPANPTITLGSSNSDTATVTGVLGVTPTGTVTFYVCGPFTTATACTTSGTKLGTVALAGSGNTATATGPSFTATSTGTYCFLGVYSGDGNYGGGSDGSTGRECFAVTPATPGVTTSPADATIGLVGSDTDTATVTGVLGITPTGTVTFYLCTGNASPCTATTTGVVDLGAVTLSGSAGTATATSASVSPLAAGTYCFAGVYSGDGDYLGGSDGSTTRECFTVLPGKPGVTTTPATANIVWGGSDSDGATVTGTDGITPTGNVHFYVCQGSAPCTIASTGAVDLGMVALSGSGDTATATGPSYMPPTTGSYCFLGVYSGDGNYSAGSDGSSDECFTVTPPRPGVTTSPSDASIVLTGTDSDTATVTGVMGVTPTGTVTFYVCGPFKSDTACTTSSTNLGTVTLSGSAGTATATGPSYKPPATGIYCFLGVYSGDGNYTGGSDGSTGECFTVTMESAVVVTTPKAASISLGQTDSDTVKVTGNASGGVPTGTVTFYVCGPTASPTPCTAMTTKLKKPVKLKKGAAADTSTATSAAFTPTKIGTWCFAGYYSGSAQYAPGSDTSVGECITVTPAVVPCSLVVTVSPNPLIETGASEIHAIVQVQACASLAGDAVSIFSSQLANSCSSLSFENLQGTGPLPNVGTNTIVAYLDDDGNLDVVVNGTNCAPGKSVVEADLVAAPYWTAVTTLVAKAPVVTAPGVTGWPNPEVETGDTPATGISDVYAVFYVETDPTYAEQTVDIGSPQLFARCGGGVIWSSNQGSSTTATATATLDDDGNAVFVFMGASCAAGTSDVIADVMAGDNPTYSTSYTILPPTPNI